MASLGKKILSAFVEVSDDEKKPVEKTTTPVQQQTPTHTTTSNATNTAAVDSRFKEYFDKLFTEANIPGPDYYEFSKMVSVMNTIPDEKVRFQAAFAGLTLQGLNKNKLLSTAEQYLQVLNTDSANFQRTVDATLHEKVHGKKQSAEEKYKRIQQLQQEIQQLQNEIEVLQKEIQDNEEKIETNTGGYRVASENMKYRIEQDIEKIKQYIN